MTYCAPAAFASAAYSSDTRAEPEEMPTVTGTRPPAASTTERTTSARSSRVSDPASPIVPVATKPCTPASISASMFSFSAGTSTSSAAVNGVVTAGMMPSKAMSGELHVGADAVDVLDGVEGGGLGVAGDDRLVDHAVLGQVDAGAAALGGRGVAQPLPQRLVHQ